jgi:hypothetical protein
VTVDKELFADTLPTYLWSAFAPEHSRITFSGCGRVQPTLPPPRV